MQGIPSSTSAARALRGFRLLVLIGLAMLTARAEAFSAFTIRDIRAEGLSRLDLGTVLTYLPVQVGDQLFFSTFYDGPMMLNLDSDRPDASIAWKGSSQSEIRTEGLHAVLATPIIDGGYIYGFCSYGQMRCLNAGDGERVWESQEATVERRRWVSGFMVRNGNRVFINNDRGDLIIARLSPDGYDEVSRTSLVKPTSRPGNRRELKDVNWVHPAYANKHVITRNDDEIVSLSLDPADYK